MVNFVLIDYMPVEHRNKRLPSRAFLAKLAYTDDRFPDRAYPDNWMKVRRAVRRYYRNRCAACLRKGGHGVHLHIHHRGTPFVNSLSTPRNKYDVRLENLVCLCSDCHKQEDRLAAWPEERLKHHALGVGTGLIAL